MPYQLCPGRREYEDNNADDYIYQFEENNEDDAWADGGEDDGSDDEEPNLIPILNQFPSTTFSCGLILLRRY